LTDIYDRATETEEQQRQQAIMRQAQRAGLAGKSLSDSASECAICDDTIPLLRRQAVPGVQTCVACQCELERATERNNA
jgi:phage/conjugal plasmid C-4 type zinc finger TraR family protein